MVDLNLFKGTPIVFLDFIDEFFNEVENQDDTTYANYGITVK